VGLNQGALFICEFAIPDFLILTLWNSHSRLTLAMMGHIVGGC
jgi:hypothetical protein